MMAFYLRDQHIQNISIDAEALSQINNVFAELEAELKEKTPQQ